MTKEKLSEQYDNNFKTLMKEAEQCSCWTHRGAKIPKCSNKKHEEALVKERRLSSLCNKFGG